MKSEHTFKITYWGTTGTLARPLVPAEITEKVVQSVVKLARSGALRDLCDRQISVETVRQILLEELPFHLRATYGGNTTCLEIATEDAILVVDAGSGFVNLGYDLVRRWDRAAEEPVPPVHVLFTHPHFDHTCAIPFAECSYDSRAKMTFWGTQRVIQSLNALFSPEGAMTGVYFPPSFDRLPGIRDLRTIEPDMKFSIGGTTIRTTSLNHPGGSLAYRFERDGRSVVVVTDHEQIEVPDRLLVEFAAEADLVYADAQYRQREYEGLIGIGTGKPMTRSGWGHGYFEGLLTTAAQAGIKQLHLGHFEPQRDDEDLARLEKEAQRQMEVQSPSAGCKVALAREGWTLKI